MNQPDVRPFVESNDVLTNAEELRRRYRRDGYLFFRRLLPATEVLELRRQVMEECRKAGWLRPGTDPMEGISDRPPLLEGEPDWVPVYEALQKMESFHRLKMRPELIAVAEKLCDEPVFVVPATIGRLGFPRDNKRITQPHQDWLYLQGSTEQISCWIPLGDVPEEVGGLKVLAGSHKAGVLRARPAEGPGGNTVDVDPSLPWVASPYQAGDALLFHQLTVHGARENRTSDRLRISIDVRYVGISHTIREDWLLPHFHWVGERFSWNALDRDWKDQSLRRYWERGPRMKTCTEEAHPPR